MSRRGNTQLFALSQPPPTTLALAGKDYHLVRVFKHDFFAATCMYEADAGDATDWPPRRIVVKFGRTQGFCGLGLAWYGRWLAAHEEDIYRAVAGVKGVPRWVGRVGQTGYAMEFIQGRPLDHLDSPPPGFFASSILYNRMRTDGLL